MIRVKKRAQNLISLFW